jgi:hypothetical protein
MSRPIASVLRFDYAFQGGPRDGFHGVADTLRDELLTHEGDVYTLGVETAQGFQTMKGGVWIYGWRGKLERKEGKGHA